MATAPIDYLTVNLSPIDQGSADMSWLPTPQVYGENPQAMSLDQIIGQIQSQYTPMPMPVIDNVSYGAGRFIDGSPLWSNFDNTAQSWFTPGDFDLSWYQQQLPEELKKSISTGELYGGDSYSPISDVESGNAVGGYGASGLVDASGNFGGGLGQGISSNAISTALGLMNAGETLGKAPGTIGIIGDLMSLGGKAMADAQINAINESFDVLGGSDQPGVVSVSDASGNVATFSTPGSVALSDANTFGGIGTSIGIGDTGSTAVGGGGVADTGTVSVDGISVSNDASIAAQDAANFGPSVSNGGGGGVGGGDGGDVGGNSVGGGGGMSEAGDVGDEGNPSGDDGGGGGGGGGDGGGCVIATHAVNSGVFTSREKKRAVVWCTRNLHDKWWGETIRRGYRYHGNKAINAGRAHQYYEEFRDFIKFATGIKRTRKTAGIFAWRCVQFFVTGLFVK